MKWADFKEASPELARLGEELFDRFGLILLGTLRANGYPRISPVEPMIVDGELELGMIWQSKKALDLVRDPRCTVHSVVSNREGTEGELKIWGRARDVQAPDERQRYCEALFEKIGWRPKEPFHLFAIDFDHAAWRKFDPSGEVHALIWRAESGTRETREKLEL